MMLLDDFLSSVPPCDYLVFLRYKYDHENEYSETVEMLEYDGNNDSHVWLHDWNEGQTDCYVICAVPFDYLRPDMFDNAIIM